MGDATKFEQMFRRFIKSFIEAEKIHQEAAELEANALEAAQRSFKHVSNSKPDSSDVGEVIHIHLHRK